MASNEDVAAALDLLADLLELQGESGPFRVRAYRTAARVVRAQVRSVEAMVDQGDDLSRWEGIGEDLAGKISMLARGQEPEALAQARQAVPAGLVTLLQVPHLGPKRVRALHRHLGVTGPKDLLKAAQAGRLEEVPGFSRRLAQQVAIGLRQQGLMAGRRLLADARAAAAPVLARLRAVPGVVRAEAAGSQRRCRESVGDLDLVVAAQDPGPVMEAFTADVQVRSRGPTRATVVMPDGMQADLRVVGPESFGASLCYFTGSKAHNIALRRRALARGLHLNEYGLHDGGTRVAGATEEEVYAGLGLPWIAPELREDEGELQAAEEGRLPELVREEDLRGDLHAHTTATDGRDRLDAMAMAARQRGYEYLAITDHSKRTAVAKGLDAPGLRENLRRVAETDASFQDLRLLGSVEVDILKDGSLDLPDGVLAETDLVVASMHFHLDLPRREQTRRLLKAVRHPLVDVIGHPTGRRIGGRAGADVDMQQVMGACQEHHTALEVNGQPRRMDLEARLCRMAKEAGLPMVISSDAHSTRGLQDIRLAVGQARRGWLAKEDVANTRPWRDLRRILKRGR